MNKRLAAAMERDNEQEDRGMHPDDRRTCWTHQCWTEECANEPMHTNPSVRHYPRPA